jgi:hypothetical protein
LADVAPLMATPFKYHCSEAVETVLRITDELLQKVVGPDAVTTGWAGGDATITVAVAGKEIQPLGPVALTEKVPAAETAIDVEVAPVLHKNATGLSVSCAVKVVEPPAQKDKGPEIVGVAVRGFIVTTKGSENPTHPSFRVTLTISEAVWLTDMLGVYCPLLHI